MAEKDDPQSGQLNDEVRRIWDANAEWWDDRIGDGNAFQMELIEPTTEKLLGDISGATVLDIGCGAGRFARRMAGLGADVVAFDFSERFIVRARERTPREAGNIEYRAIDATDREQLLSLGAGRFDVAVATMALMDISTIEPLMGALGELLKPGGMFVFSVMHPCFFSGESGRFIEETTVEGRLLSRSGVKVMAYLTPTACKGEGIVGQPEPQYYFYRPLSVLLAPAFDTGFVVDGLEEPAFEPRDTEGRASRWPRMPEIPQALVVRMRLMGR